MKLLRPCLTLTALLLVLCCGAYPLAVTAAAQTLFPDQARGSLVVTNGRVRGSTLLGQPGAAPGYFWSRPSAASVDAATGLTVSSGSNLGPRNPALREAAQQREVALRAAGLVGAAPAELVTASASGLDPHVSPEGALAQVPRVARARGVSEASLRALVAAHTEGRTLGLLGAPRVNVLALNVALDAR
jgi:K+-transporting ATPase ATPase C chain